MESNPGLMKRLAEATRYVIAGVKPDTWFSPSQPMAPMAPEEVKGRQFDYPVSYNLNFQPRATEPIGFARLRSFAENCDILREVIERQKDLVEGFQWQVLPRETKKGERPPETEYAAEIKAIEEFFRMPDKIHDWNQWLRALLEDVFVIDAPAVYIRPTRGGGVYALELMDGATIFPLIDATGRQPVSPSPAYQQRLKGVPATDYTSDELIYYPKNPRTNRVYGSPPVQWIINTAETEILRMISQKAYFTEGNINDAIFTGPSDWSIDQIVQWQQYWDDQFAGDLAMRRHGKWVPGDTKFQQTKEPALKDNFDEWLARIICFAFSTSPAPFISIQNRGNQENQQQVAEEGGIVTYLGFVKRLMDRIIERAFQNKDLEFVWEMGDEFDPEVAAKIDDMALSKAGITIDEWRAKRGLEPLPGGLGKEPIVFTAGGATRLKDCLDPPEPLIQPGLPGAEAGAGLGEPVGEAGDKSPPASPKDKALEKRSKSRPTRTISDPPLEREYIKQVQNRAERIVLEALQAAKRRVVAELEPQLAGLQKAAPLYVRRNLTQGSAAAFLEWAREQGFDKPVPELELHATVVFSRDPVDLFAEGGEVVATPGGRRVAALGDKGAVVLFFEAPALDARWLDAREKGASWDYPSYHTHVTISYQAGDLDLSTVEPYAGPLVFGPEIHAPIDDGWVERLTKASPGDFVDELPLTEIIDLSDELEPLLANVASESGGEFLAQIGAVNTGDLLDRVNERAVVFARDRAAELVGKRLVDGVLVDSPTAGITETTRELLRGTITKGLEDNIGLRGIIDAIEADYAFSPQRARLIAHTEIARANSQGSLDAAREARDVGIEVKKLWLLGQDPCDVCLENADEGVIDLDADFSSGDDAPPAHPNCYCSLSYQVELKED